MQARQQDASGLSDEWIDIQGHLGWKPVCWGEYHKGCVDTLANVGFLIDKGTFMFCLVNLLLGTMAIYNKRRMCKTINIMG